MSRRDFIKAGVIGTIATALVPRFENAQRVLVPKIKEFQPPSLNPAENESLRIQLIEEMNSVQANKDLRTMRKEENRMVENYFDQPFSLRFVLPAIMHAPTRAKVMERLWQFRTMESPKPEIKEYQELHPHLSAVEREFCQKHGLNKELFASIKENMPAIRATLKTLDIHEELIPNVAKLAMLNQTETAGGIYLGDGPAYRQWRSDRYDECHEALGQMVTDIHDHSEQYSGLKYRRSRLFGSTRPKKAYSGGAIGVQFMPYRLRFAIPEGHKGLNPYDVFFDGQLMIAYYLSSERNIRFVERVVKERNQDFKPESKNGELDILKILWNNSPKQVQSIARVGHDYP